MDAVPCHIRDCDAPPTVACDGCGQMYCARHIRNVSVERRQDPDAIPHARWGLARPPSRIESYALCPRCSTKPIVGKLAREALQ